jgi:RimJ/RimL family protein N-acetyltransferase
MSDDRSATIATERLRLIPATPAMIDAELEAPDRLSAALGAAIPTDWPPEPHNRKILAFWRAKLLAPGSAGWWLHYAVLTDRSDMILIGSVGYKGPPRDREVEIGYSVVPSHQRRGLATEACRGLIAHAWDQGANVVIAHTFEHLTPSLGVLRKLGFERCASGQSDVLEFRLHRPTA